MDAKYPDMSPRAKERIVSTCVAGKALDETNAAKADAYAAYDLAGKAAKDAKDAAERARTGAAAAVVDENTAASKAQVATSEAKAAALRASTAASLRKTERDVGLVSMLWDEADKAAFYANDRAEGAAARAETATARAISAEMNKRPPDLAALQKLLEAAQQQHAQRPTPEGQGMIDALRDYLRLAAQRKAN